MAFVHDAPVVAWLVDGKYGGNVRVAELDPSALRELEFLEERFVLLVNLTDLPIDAVQLGVGLIAGRLRRLDRVDRLLGSSDCRGNPKSDDGRKAREETSDSERTSNHVSSYRYEQIVLS